MAMSRGRFRGRQGSRRRTAWEFGPGDVTIQTQITSSQSVILNSFVSPLTDGLTVARIRGELLMFLRTGAAALDGYLGAFGIGIASVAACTAGAGSVPTPITEQGAENWLYWTPISLLACETLDGSVSTDLSGVGGTTSVIRHVVDTKAMRKFPIDQAIYACLEVMEQGASILNMHFDSRMLLFLP